VVRAGFEEREYESAFNAELAVDYGFARRLWTPGTMLEEIVGYDVAGGVPSRDAIWRLLKVSRPAGVRLLPLLWNPGAQPAADRLPSLPVSLVLQFKRPEYLDGNASKQYRYWRCAYFRFKCEARQHAVLRRLEQRVTQDLVVRYAAPAFHKTTDLERARLDGKVCASSGFVSPARLGSHSVWTYKIPGVDGYPNPSGDATHFDSLGDLRMLLLQAEGPVQELALPNETGAVSRNSRDEPDSFDERPYPGPIDELQPMEEHLARLSAALTYRSPSLREPLQRWRRALERADLPIGPRAMQIVVDLATVQTAMTAVNATWFIYSD
jgi:hypothetical protein